MSINRRLDKLEQETTGNGKMYVLYRFADESDEQAEQAASISPTESDLVV